MTEGVTKKPLNFYVFSFDYVNSDEELVAIDLHKHAILGELESWFAFWSKYGNALTLSRWRSTYANYLQTESVNDSDGVEVDQVQVEAQTGEKFADDGAAADQVEDEHSAAWIALWQQLMQEVHDQHYHIFAKIYENRVQEILALECGEELVEPKIEPAEIKDENGVDKEEEVIFISSEIEELTLLGLPTAFGGRRTVKPKSQQKQTKATERAASQVSARGGSADKDNESSEELDYDSTAEVDESEEVKEIEEEHTDDEAQADLNTTKDSKMSLHGVHDKAICKKPSKNRKLRNLPEFVQKDKGLLKYWHRRFSLFSRFDEGIRLDREGWFSVTPEKVALHMAERLACDIIVDGFCGCGGNAIHFARSCGHVIAVDIDAEKLAMARHNARIYGVAHKIEFILGDFLQLSASGQLHGDTVFLSPPWGGPKYKDRKQYDIEEHLAPVPATQLMTAARKISSNVALFLPRNSEMRQIIKLAGSGQRCEVEHNYLDTRLVGLTALYGEQLIVKKEPKNEEN